MTYRINRVKAELEVYVPFEGTYPITLDYAPAEDDPLPELLLARWRELQAQDEAQTVADGGGETSLG